MKASQNFRISVGSQDTRKTRSHKIRHSYFISLSRLSPEHQFGALKHVWNTQILPLLEEYFYSRRDMLKEILTEFVLREGEADMQVGFAEGEDLMAALSAMGASQESGI